MNRRRLVVHHLTRYRYDEPVDFGEHHMMFRPRESHDLRLLSAVLDISPEPCRLRWVHDVFDNSVAIATFDTAAAELRFASTLTLEHVEIVRPDYALESRAQTYPFAYTDSEKANLRQALRRRHRTPSVDAWIGQFYEAGTSVDTMDLLRRVTVGIRRQFAYERRTEKGVRTPSETLAQGRGSCRDFALLMMEGVRSLGFAARFVSGYIFLPGLAEAETNGGAEPIGESGGGNTHAWMQVYLPGAGWIDFDPTNNIVGNRNLIRVAVVWDPAQALPLWGTYSGSAAAFRGMEVNVTVTESQPSG